MRPIREIIWHCTATPAGRHFDVDDVRGWHRERGWSDIGYHFLILLDGTIQVGRPADRVGSHVAGRNTGTLGIAYVGGLSASTGSPMDTRTVDQKKAGIKLVFDLLRQYPTITRISGHRDYANKACPCFDAGVEFSGVFLHEVRTTGSAPAVVEREEALKVTASRANLRDTPGGRIIRALPRNTSVIPTGVRSGDWLQVQPVTGQPGWMHESVLSSGGDEEGGETTPPPAPVRQPQQQQTIQSPRKKASKRS